MFNDKEQLTKLQCCVIQHLRNQNHRSEYPIRATLKNHNTVIYKGVTPTNTVIVRIKRNTTYLNNHNMYFFHVLTCLELRSIQQSMVCHDLIDSVFFFSLSSVHKIIMYFRIDGYQDGISEKAMAPHSSTLAWKIPWTEEPGGLQSM